jgi:hypothetical protein
MFLQDVGCGCMNWIDLAQDNVAVKLSLNFIIGCWGYTLDREDRVS